MVTSDLFTFFIDISDGYVDSSLLDLIVDYYMFGINLHIGFCAFTFESLVIKQNFLGAMEERACA